MASLSGAPPMAQHLKYGEFTLTWSCNPPFALGYSLDSVLSYLKKRDLVMMDDLLGEYVQVTHEGWRIWQTALSASFI